MDDRKKKTKQNYAITIGTVFIDIGKLAIGSLIFGAVLRGSLNPVQILLFGAAFAIIFIVTGVILVVLFKE
jgi:hypothetical protein